MPDLLSTTVRAPGHITPENFEFLRSIVYRESGIVLDETKLYLLESRLIPILQSDRIATLNDLCMRLRGFGANVLQQRVVEAMTTNETLFFRDPPAFAAIKDVILPELIERRKAVRKLSLWSAAASSGQEAYSLAMLILDLGLPGWTIRILGTDLNSQILKRARAGRYLQLEVDRGLPPEYLPRYFRREGADWCVREEVRRMVEFQTLDLRHSQRLAGEFDLILCRNVLIYFDVETKKNILRELRRSLSHGGYLLLGCAENTLHLDTEFDKRRIDQATFYQAP